MMRNIEWISLSHLFENQLGVRMITKTVVNKEQSKPETYKEEGQNKR